MNFQQIEHCRLCRQMTLIPILDLGDQALTGFFPASEAQEVPRAPLQLVKCHGEGGCGLVQLRHTYDLHTLYGMDYGYQSSLNASMVRHLQSKVQAILDRMPLGGGDVVIDIGSNDGTTLKAYPESLQLRRMGVDPTGVKFHHLYPDNIELIPDFFSYSRIQPRLGDQKAKVITSFSMLYDLEDPLAFAKEVRQILADDGIWVFEQSYLPTMLERNSFDTICHEHLEYYALHPLVWMLDRAGFKILDVELNDINGGSLSVVCTTDAVLEQHCDKVQILLKEEHKLNILDLPVYEAFAKRVQQLRQEVLNTLHSIVQRGKTIFGLGASTKGNVLLQYCGIDRTLLPAIGEVNADKYGCWTPGTRIPIVPESEVLAKQPDYLFVLPWHFRPFFEKVSSLKGRQLVFPLPQVEVV